MRYHIVWMVRTIIEEQVWTRGVRSRGPDSGSRIIEHRTIERETLMHNLRYYSNSHVSIANRQWATSSKKKSNERARCDRISWRKHSDGIGEICNSIYMRRPIHFSSLQLHIFIAFLRHISFIWSRIPCEISSWNFTSAFDLDIPFSAYIDILNYIISYINLLIWSASYAENL